MSERTFPWRTLLFVSVAINLLIVGAAAGAYSAGVRLERAAPPAATALAGPRAMMASLPADTRTKVRDQLARTWAETRALRQSAAQARRDAFDIAATEPFNAASVRSAFARVRSSDDAALAAFHNDMIEALAQMTPEQRQRAIAALRGASPIRRAASRDSVAQPATGAPLQPNAVTPRPRFRETVRERILERRERRRERQGPTP
ncbi:MAG: periplasmic heavy metal sensor [Proteobacteria bacterium]|nr:periplasmic heavy metal sensor [Pseudomonadota bacterium]